MLGGGGGGREGGMRDRLNECNDPESGLSNLKTFVHCFVKKRV